MKRTDSLIFARYGVPEDGKIFHGLVKIRKPRVLKGKIMVCPECGKERYYTPYQLKRLKSHYCKRCSPRIFPYSNTKVPRQWVVQLLQHPKSRNMMCIAAAVGLSRTRVRQIAVEEGITRFTNKVRNFSWNCSQCGVLVERKLYAIKHNKNPALCKNCSKGRGRFCMAGHENPKRNKNGSCRTCANMKAKRIVGYRTCQDCGKVLPVTYGGRVQAKIHGYTLKRCLSCHGKYALKLARKNKPPKPYCLRGHARTPENVNKYGRCKTCNRLKDRKRRDARLG